MTWGQTFTALCDFASREVRFLVLSKPELVSFAHQINGLQSPWSNGPDLPFAYRDFTFCEVGGLLTSFHPISKLLRSPWTMNDTRSLFNQRLWSFCEFALHESSWLCPLTFPLCESTKCWYLATCPFSMNVSDRIHNFVISLFCFSCALSKG